MEIKKILVPTDFSDGSERAFRYAVRFATKVGASIHLLHVVDVPEHYFVNLETLDVDVGTFQNRVYQDAKTHLEEFLAREPHRDVPVDSALRAGFAWKEIQEEAEEKGVDLVITSTHGRGGIRRALLGSVAEKLVRTAPVPVITVKAPHEREEEPPEFRLSRILFPTDFSDTSLASLPSAVELAEKFQAEIDVLYVMEDFSNFPVVSWEHLPGVTPEQFYEHAEKRALENLKKHIEEKVPGANWVNYEVRRGHPESEIVRETEEDAYDLIVMSTHGRTGILHAVFGSTTEKVVRKANCPVLTLKA